jgi:hypothetical protein
MIVSLVQIVRGAKPQNESQGLYREKAARFKCIASVVGQPEKHIPAGAKSRDCFEAFTARLKPRPFKTDSN